MLASWLRDAAFWKDGGRKLGINLSQIQIIDGLANGLGVRTGKLADVEAEILKMIDGAKGSMKGDGRIQLVLDGLDLVLAALESPVMEVLEMIGELREVCFNQVCHFPFIL